VATPVEPIYIDYRQPDGIGATVFNYI